MSRSMQSNQLNSPEEIIMMKLLSKIQMHEAQKTLLAETINGRTLLESKMISSLQPTFEYSQMKALKP